MKTNTEGISLALTLTLFFSLPFPLVPASLTTLPLWCSEEAVSTSSTLLPINILCYLLCTSAYMREESVHLYCRRMEQNAGVFFFTVSKFISDCIMQIYAWSWVLCGFVQHCQQQEGSLSQESPIIIIIIITAPHKPQHEAATAHVWWAPNTPPPIGHARGVVINAHLHQYEYFSFKVKGRALKKFWS